MVAYFRCTKLVDREYLDASATVPQFVVASSNREVDWPHLRVSNRGAVMPVNLPLAAPPRRRGEWDGPQIAAVCVGLVGLGCFAALAWSIPSPLVLPSLSVLAAAIAGLIATLAWAEPRRRRADRVTYWDLAGVLALVSAFAALLSDPSQVIPLLEGGRAP